MLLKKGIFLFVGTKKQASELIRQTGIKTKQPYVDNRWLGGTLTNLKTIKKRVARLKELEQLFESGDISVYPKKEQAQMQKELDKLNRFLGGIRDMDRLPRAIFVVDSENEKKRNPRSEKKLGLKYMGLQIPTLIQVTLITLFQQTMMLSKLSN